MPNQDDFKEWLVPEKEKKQVYYRVEKERLLEVKEMEEDEET